MLSNSSDPYLNLNCVDQQNTFELLAVLLVLICFEIKAKEDALKFTYLKIAGIVYYSNSIL